MKFTDEIKEKWVIYNLSGRLIGEHDGMALIESVSNHVAGGHKNIIIDMSELEHINSSGLGVLITLLTKIRKADGELSLASPAENVSNLLTITKLNTIFKVFRTIDEAIAS